MRDGAITLADSNGSDSSGIDMDNVVKLKDGNPIDKPDEVSDIIAWLREYADRLEKGEVRPAHKAVLIIYEKLAEKFRISTAYCNAEAVERAGMISLSLHGTVDFD